MLEEFMSNFVVHNLPADGLGPPGARTLATEVQH